MEMCLRHNTPRDGDECIAFSLIRLKFSRFLPRIKAYTFIFYVNCHLCRQYRKDNKYFFVEKKWVCYICIIKRTVYDYTSGAHKQKRVEDYI